MHPVSSQASFLFSDSSPSSLSTSLSSPSHISQNSSGLSLMLAESPRAGIESGVSPSFSQKMKTFAAAAKIASDGNKLGVIFTRPSRPEWIQGVAYTESEARQPIPSYFAMVYPATRLSSQALEAASDLPSRDECLVELTTLLAGEITEDAVDVQSRDRHLERSDSTNAMFELEGNRFFGSSLGSDDRPTTTF